MCCCPVAVQFSVQLFIFALYINSFRIGVYSILEFIFPKFFVAFIPTDLCYS